MSLLSWLWSGVRTFTGTRAGVGHAQGDATGTAAIGQALGIIAGIGTAAGTGTASSTPSATRAAVGTAQGTGTAAAIAFVVSATSNPGVLDAIRLEFALPSASAAFADTSFAAAAFGGTGWQNVISDTRDSDAIVLDYGVTGNGPDDRVGSTGTLTFTLNNAADNSGGVTSYYSPLHAAKRTGLSLNLPVRLVLVFNGQPYYKFLGRLAEMQPEPGRHGTYRVPCTAVDLMDDWAVTDLPIVLPIVQGLDAASLVDYLFTQLVTVAPDLAPATRSLETGEAVVPYAFHDPTRRKIRELIIDAVMTEFGFASFRGGVDSGGNFLFANRHASSTYDVQASLINQFSIADGFQATQSRDALASSIEVFVYPAAIDAVPIDGGLVDLFVLAGTPLEVFPFQTVVIHLPFKSPAHPDTAVAALQLVPLAAYTDYTMNTSADGLGQDITNNFTVTHLFSSGGFEAVVSITNSGTPGLVPGPIANVPTGYVTLLKGRGRGLYIQETSVKLELNSFYGRRPHQVVMPWQDNLNTATDIAHFVGNLYKNPIAQVDSVTFCANKTQTLMEAAIYLEPGSLVYIQEDVTGIAGTFRIQGVHLEIAHDILWCTWRVQAVDRQTFWLLGVATRSELGLSTILGF